MRLTAMIAALAATSFSAPVIAETGGETDWRLTVGGGITALGDDRDQPYGSVSLRRNLGDLYLSLGGTLVGYSGRDPVAGDTVPASTQQITLGAGYETNALAIDTFVSIGDRDFEEINLRGPNDTPLVFNADGSTWAIGASVTYQIALTDRLFASPFIAVDYSEIETAQILAAQTGQFITRDIEEDGVTGSGGATLQYAIGDEGQHSLGVYGAVVTTSNTAATTRIVGTDAATGAPQRLAGVSDGDTWFEYGATAGFALSETIMLDLWVSRTAGLRFGEATSAAVSLSFDF